MTYFLYHIEFNYLQLKLLLEPNLKDTSCTFDLWFAKASRTSFLGLTAHWIDKLWNLLSATLCVNVFKGMQNDVEYSYVSVTLH